MSYVYGTSFAALPQAATPQTVYHGNVLFDDFSQQLASSWSVLRRRHSRGSAGYRTPVGVPMRVVKPVSANNSPRTAAMMQARRRTVVNDNGVYAPRRPVADGQEYLPVHYNVAARPPRPVSWHPSSTHVVPSQAPVAVAAAPYQVPAYATSAADFEPFPSVQPFTLSPAAYSIQTSPSATLSPYAGAFDTTTSTSQYYSPNPWTLSPSVNTNGAMFDKLPSPVDCPALIAGQQQQQMPVSQAPQPQIYKQLSSQQQPQQQPFLEDNAQSVSVDSTASWTFTAQGFDRATAPPTPPDNCYVAQETLQASASAETAVSYQPLEDDESDGEILVGMGLYDPPEKEVLDPTLQSYRSSVAHLLGAAYKYPEPTGKGLKLEDSWEPPENLDDDDQDDEDGEAEADE